jgi:hypothetical protein
MLDNDTNYDLDELIRRSTQMEVPVGVESRLRGRLAEFRTRVEQRPTSRLRTLAHALLQAPRMRTLGVTAALVMAVAAGLVFIPERYSGGRAYAAAAEQLRSSRSLEYTLVFNAEPYVAVDFSFLTPRYERFSCTWGIEVRADHETGKQIVLMHAARTYLIEEGKQVNHPAGSEDLVEQLRSLPQHADEALGEQRAGESKLTGYRLRKPPNGAIAGLKALDLWIDARTRQAHHVDITVQEQGKPAYQMHIQNIRVGAEVNRSLFDLTPPAGYTAIAIPAGDSRAGERGPVLDTRALRAQIGHGAPWTAVVMPMHGPYAQTRFALQAVESYLKALGVAPTGPPFGRYQSEQHWEAGYGVAPGTRVDAPFKIISLPGTSIASAVVKGGWARDSNPRWAAFLKSVVEQGYLPSGPAMEIWSGDDARPANQVTEMRIPVTKAD